MKNIDEMIESIEAVKGGHVTRLTASDGTRTQEFVLPFDSTPPSLVVVSREGLVDLIGKQQLEHKLVCEQFVKQADEQNAAIIRLAEMYNSKEGELLQLRRNTAPQPNLPLTFDQLKERVGKPVYRVHKNGDRGWFILSDVRETHSAGEVKYEIKIAPQYIREYVGYNPALVEYYDHE